MTKLIFNICLSWKNKIRKFKNLNKKLTCIKNKLKIKIALYIKFKKIFKIMNLNNNNLFKKMNYN